jgi:serine phosphatase RsbU (regulator of sigma subunit)
MLSICRGTRRPPMTDNEIEVAVNLARRAAMALDNARLYARERAATARLQGANERLRRLVAHERTVARALQDAMLTRLPRTETVQLVARYVPANSDVQVGGDWYDAVVLPDGSKALMIGDVVGHDIGAAALMGQLRNLLRGFVWDRDESPAATVVRLDRAIRDLGLGTLATLVLARVAPPEGDRPRLVRWTSAGHPAPVLVAPDGTARFLDQVPDPLLGVLPDSERCDQQVEVPRGATLVLYTDGLVERRDEDLDERRERLLAVLAEHHGKPLDEMLDAVLAEMVGDQRGDDVAVLGARFTPPDC